MKAHVPRLFKPPKCKRMLSKKDKQDLPSMVIFMYHLLWLAFYIVYSFRYEISEFVIRDMIWLSTRHKPGKQLNTPPPHSIWSLTIFITLIWIKLALQNAHVSGWLHCLDNEPWHPLTVRNYNNITLKWRAYSSLLTLIFDIRLCLICLAWWSCCGLIIDGRWIVDLPFAGIWLVAMGGVWWIGIFCSLKRNDTTN